MTETEIQEEVIKRMSIILGPPRPKKGVMVLVEEWAGDWKLWMYCYSGRPGNRSTRSGWVENDYSFAAYNHKLSLRGIAVQRLLSAREIECNALVCTEHLLPALRRATVLHALAEYG